ncbi:MAG: hypothetical protein JWO47_693 [Candidatus Saccharibacteria bacterium]|nr:hypothetical protein [Candidatus Saccharibacteria bacterium]
MSVEFKGPVIPVRIDGENASLRIVRDMSYNIEAASVLSNPDANPPYVQLTLISPPGPHYKEVCADKITGDPEPNRARLMFNEPFGVDKLIANAMKRVSKSRHPAGRGNAN